MNTINDHFAVCSLLSTGVAVVVYSSVAKLSDLFHFPTVGKNVCTHKIAQS